ncbi:unnamed protein product [Owenia fusiformis]|uniref:Uncharacterized protein n=1 Tax=Owenia fusiformis TaxID=6347 RepID=A0A8J1XG59_OWEFU|nr:unnamed protein product [Owenia fusiformis]
MFVTTLGIALLSLLTARSESGFYSDAKSSADNLAVSNSNSNKDAGCVWGDWGTWSYSGCTSTCGPGKRQKRRMRKNLFPKESSKQCPSISVETGFVDCEETPCPVCVWGDWGTWVHGGCSSTCGPGKRPRKRTRRILFPKESSKKCPGASVETGVVDCERPPCPGEKNNT